MSGSKYFVRWSGKRYSVRARDMDGTIAKLQRLRPGSHTYPITRVDVDGSVTDTGRVLYVPSLAYLRPDAKERADS